MIERFLAGLGRVYFHPPDVGAGDGGTPAAGAGVETADSAVLTNAGDVQDDNTSGDVDDAVRNARTDDGDVDDDDDDDSDDFADLDHNNPRIKALVNKVRKTGKKNARYRALVEPLRGAGGRFLSPAELRQKATLYDNIEQAASRNPKLRAALFGDDEPATGRRQPARDDDDDAPFDESQFADFDQDHPATRVMKAQARQLHESKRLLKQLQKQVGDVVGGQAREAHQKTVTTWKTTTETAAKRIPEFVEVPNVGKVPMRQIFQDAVYGAFAVAKARGINLDPQKVIAHYIKQTTGVSGKEATKIAADAQRVAEKNKTLPRASAVVPSGSPSPARTAKETVAQVSQRLRKHFG